MGLFSRLQRAFNALFGSTTTSRENAQVVAPEPSSCVLDPAKPTQYHVSQVDKDGKTVALPSEPLPFDRTVWVSRHGLSERGVTCPTCKRLVVKPGNYAAITVSKRGESVPCPFCKIILLASPNDDEGDPKPGSGDLDPLVYYAFVRPGPAVEVIKRKRISSAPIQVQTWVVIQTWSRLSNGQMQLLNDQEGRVVEIGDMAIAGKGVVPAARVAVNGNEGLAGAHDMGADLEWIPLAQLRAMILPTLRPGDTVTASTGAYAGNKGVIDESFTGQVYVRYPGVTGRVSVPIEHVTKFEPLEIFPTAETVPQQEASHV